MAMFDYMDRREMMAKVLRPSELYKKGEILRKM
jgi:hypothetical protein